jgi:PAS domain S-box-containing protein
LLVVAFLILMIFLNARNSSAVFESPILLALLNTVFLCVIPLAIAYMAAKSHHATGILAFLYAGCGLAFFGISSLYAGWVMPLAGNPNPTVTLHNLGSLFAGICQFLGAHFFLQELTGISETKPRRVQRYWILYAEIFVLVSFTALLAFRGNLPFFFDPLTGASPLRQYVLGAAICLFAVSGLMFLEIYAVTKTEFAYWYGLALWLIAIGLTCVFLQRNVGSMIGWTGRVAQYLGGLYFIVAFLWGKREMPVTASTVNAKTNRALWPYLEMRVGERTAALIQANEAMQKEIAERRQAEEALRASEAKYRRLFEDAAIGVFHSTFEGRFMDVNPALARMLGYESPREVIEAITNISEQVYVDPPQRDKIVTDALAKGEAVVSENRYRRKDGSIWIGNLILRHVMDADGKPQYLEGFVENITARKQAEEALRENEKNLRILFETMTEGIALNEIVYDENGEMVDYRILSVNSAFYSIAGYSDKNVIGGFATQLYGMSQEFITEFWKQHKQKNSVAHTEMDSPTSDKRFFISTSPFVNDRFVTSFFDITERKRAEENLQASEASLKFSQQVAHVGHWTWDTVTNRITWSDEMKRIFGLDPDTFDGDMDKVIAQAIHPDDLEKVNASNASVLTEQIPVPLEYRVIWPDGSVHIIWAEAGEKIFDANGKITKLNGIVQDITQRRHYEIQIERQLKRLSTLRTIETAISSSFDPLITLDIFLKEVTAQLKIDAASVLLVNPLTKTLDYMSSSGFRSSAIRNTKLSLGQGFAGRVLLERRTIHIPDLEKEKSSLVNALLLEGENFTAYVGVPLIAKGEIVGVMEVFHRTLLDPEFEWLDFLEILAGQAAIAIENAQLFENLKRANIDLTLAYDATIEGWSRAMDLRDKETEGHTQRVTKITVQLAEKMGIPQQELIHVRRGALLHDIGKLGVPDHILFKPDKLTEEEWGIMRQHTTYAFNMLFPITYLRAALDIPFCHHERWDGSGYPRGLKGEQIPLAARLFAVVDVWDALISDRPYRAAWSKEKALAHIEEQSGEHFDPAVIEVALSYLKEYDTENQK